MSALGPGWMLADRACAGTHPGRLGGYLVGDFIRKSHQGRTELGFTVLKTPGSQYTVAQGKHPMRRAFIAAREKHMMHDELRKLF